MAAVSMSYKRLSFLPDVNVASTSPRCWSQHQVSRTIDCHHRRRTFASQSLRQQPTAADAHEPRPISSPWAAYHERACQLNTIATVLAACITVHLVSPLPSLAVIAAADADLDTFENVPSQLSSQGEAAGVPLSSVVSGPKKKEIEGCTRKCVPTCVRGGGGAPGLGPISVRKEIIVFKEGFRSRQYCLSECAQVCALSFDKDKAALLLPSTTQK